MKHIQWKPYVYKLTLTKGDETYFYIGSRSSRSNKRNLANPQELFDGRYNSSSEVVHKLLEEGWECKREILHTYEGTREGAMECCEKEKELLRSVGAQQSDQWLNMHNGGASPHVHSQEYSEKMSEALKGREFSSEHRRKLKEARKRQKRSPHSEATKKKISQARKGQPCALKGKPRSAETKRRISEGLMGKEKSEAAKKRMSESKKGKPWSPARRAAYEAKKSKPSPHKGKPWSPARRAAHEAKKAQKSSENS